MRTDIESSINDIMKLDKPTGHRVKLLHRLAEYRRDLDDLEGFVDVIGYIPLIGPTFKFVETHTFRLMYSGKRAIIVCHEKHENVYFEAGTPDDFARSCLTILDERLRENYYSEATKSFTAPLQVNPMHPVFLDILPTMAHLFVASKEEPVGVTYRQLWRNDGAYGAISEIPSSLVMDEIKNIVENKWLSSQTSLAFDNVLCLLMLNLSDRDRAHGAYLRDYISKQQHLMGSKAARFASGFELSPADMARDILENVDPTGLRRAGRKAYDFLTNRDRAEYEKVELVYLRHVYHH